MISEQSNEPSNAEISSRDTQQEVAPKVYSMKDVSVHNTPNDMWLVIDNEVYDVTKFRHEHPGGAKILLGVAGKDATTKFDKYHRRALLNQHKPSLRVGILDFPDAMQNSKRGFLQKLRIGKRNNG